MQVKSIAECSSAILSTFLKLPFDIKIFVLSIFEWPLKTGPQGFGGSGEKGYLFSGSTGNFSGIWGASS